MFPDYDPETNKQLKVLSKNQLEYIIKQCNFFAKTLQTIDSDLPYDLRVDFSNMNEMKHEDGLIVAQPGVPIR